MWNSIAAIAAGTMVDYLGSPLVFLVIGLVMPWVAVHFNLEIGLGMDVLGGFVTGVISARNKVGHAAVTGCAVFTLAFVFIWHFPAQLADPASVVLLIPAETLGGWLASKLKPPGPKAPRGPVPPIASPF